jgi:aminodeoxyfutalosine deaminase
MRDLARIPKSELHVHLRGAMPVEVFCNLLSRHPIKEILSSSSDAHRRDFYRYPNIRAFLDRRSPTEEDVRMLFRYQTFDQFLATWKLTGYLVRDRYDLQQLVHGVVQSLRSQAVRYAEITVSIIEYLQMGTALDDIADCLMEGSQTTGIQIQWIVDLVRDTGPQKAQSMLREIVSLECPAIVGITLGGSEHLFPPAPFAAVYQEAREHGLRLTVHAGEASGAASVWDAIRLLGVARIGHGVRAVEDPTLVAYLAEHCIPLEVCPTSNIQTGIFPSYDSHPVHSLFAAGVPITINSDDPTFFGTTLTRELELLSALGIDEEGIRNIIDNGFRYAFLPQQQIDAYLQEVDRAWCPS